MGNYTKHTVEVLEGDFSLIAALREFSEGARVAIDNNGEDTCCCKWYDSMKDLVAFSALHPDALFELRGYGEDDFDIWNAYFKNGKMQYGRATVTYDKYDVEKLK